MSNRGKLLGVLSSAVLLAAACACGSSIEYRYYDLALDAPAPKSAAPVDANLTIAPVEVAVAYNDLKVAYRVSRYELKYDVASAWVSKPGRVVQHALYQYLDRSGAFANVATTVSPPPDLRLDAYVEVIEEDASGSSSRANLRIQLTLRDAKTGDALHRDVLEGSRELDGEGAEATVAALSAILSSEMGRALPGIVAAAEGRERSGVQ